MLNWQRRRNEEKISPSPGSIVESVVQVALRLLNEEGAEGLSLRRLASELHVQAPALYWHFANKQALLDAMATHVFRETFASLGSTTQRTPSSGRTGAASCPSAERQMLPRYRDGYSKCSAAPVSPPTRRCTHPWRLSLRKLTNDGFSLAAALEALSTLHCYVVGFTVEEQAVWPKPGQRDQKICPRRAFNPHG